MNIVSEWKCQPLVGRTQEQHDMMDDDDDDDDDDGSVSFPLLRYIKIHLRQSVVCMKGSR